MSVEKKNNIDPILKNTEENNVKNIRLKSNKKCSKYKTKGVEILKKFYNYILAFGDENKLENSTWWKIWIFFVFFAIFTRLMYINTPNHVMWDEAHFGKMMSWYINGTYFFDVHPPGGKLLITLFGYLGGYNGTHSFTKPGWSIEGYPGILSARLGCALFGSAIVPFGYCIVWRLTSSITSAVLAAMFISLDLGSIMLSKYILLDPYLMCFMMASFHGFTLIHHNRQREYSVHWWGAMSYTGLMLGCVMSIKFIGIFVVTVVGLYTIQDLWKKLGQVERTLADVLWHLNARILTLIVIPLVVYIFIFSIHDSLLYMQKSESDNGLGMYSSRFQMNFKNSSLNNMTQPKDLSYGNIITLKNPVIGGLYLHSHHYLYPSTNLTQVTGHRGRDVNNFFRVLYPEDEPDHPEGSEFYDGQPEKIRNGDWIRLRHLATKTTVTCSKQPSVLTRKQLLVYAKNETASAIDDTSLSSNENTGGKSMFEMWNVEIVGGNDTEARPIEGLDTKFRLICVPLNCALTWSKATLPKDWGFEQEEMTCTKNRQDPYTEWAIEMNYNPYDDETKNYSGYASNFVERFLESHQVMAFINGRFVPKGAEYYFGHRPWMWPICYKSQPWYDDGMRFVLLGNPLIFWINLIFLIISPFMIVKYAYDTIRFNIDEKCISANQLSPIEDDNRERVIFAIKWLLIAYLLHYLPFFFMNRILYYHHYFPALQFSSMISAVILGYIINTFVKLENQFMTKVVRQICILVLFMSLFITFCLYSPITFGYPTYANYNVTNSTYRHLMAFDEWEI